MSMAIEDLDTRSRGSKFDDILITGDQDRGGLIVRDQGLT